MQSSKVNTYADARLKPAMPAEQILVNVRPADGEGTPSGPDKKRERYEVPLEPAQSLEGVEVVVVLEREVVVAVEVAIALGREVVVAVAVAVAIAVDISDNVFAELKDFNIA